MLKKTILFLCLIFATPVFATSFKSLALIGDAGVKHPFIEKLRNSLKDHDVKDIVLLGDNLYDPQLTYVDVWKPWRVEGFQFEAVAIGNHNLGIEQEVKFFGLPSDFYSITFQSARFIVLDSENALNIDAQMNFLETTLLNPQLEKQVYLVLHHPYVTTSDHHSWTERLAFQNKLRPLIYKYSNKLTAVLSGHDHLASFIDVNSLPLIISGASYESQPAKKLNYLDQVFRVNDKWQYKGGKYWVRLDISDQAEAAWVTFVAFDSAADECRVRIFPRPYKMMPNCNSIKVKSHRK